MREDQIFSSQTLWFVTYAVPLLELMERGSLPGYEFGVDNVNVVLEGELKCIRSLGRRTKPCASSMTQLQESTSSALIMESRRGQVVGTCKAD